MTLLRVFALLFVASHGYGSLGAVGAAQQVTQPRWVEQRSQLQELELWRDVTIDLVGPRASGGAVRVPAKTVFYKPGGGTPDWLTVFSEPRSQHTYVVGGGSTFYVAYGGDVLSAFVGPGILSWRRSYFKVPTAQGNQEAAIARFLSNVDDEALSQAAKRRVFVSLRLGSIPDAFFLANSNPSTSQNGFATVAGIELRNGILRLELLSPAEKYKGTFWIDLDAVKLVRSVVDGKEVFRN